MEARKSLSRPAMFTIIASVSLVLLLVGCGGSSPTFPLGTAIAVTLREYSVTPSRATAPAGRITFDVGNQGTVEHEFLVVRTDLDANILPRNADGSYAEDAPGTVVVGEIPDFAAGTHQQLTLDLDAGHYALVCNRVVGGMSHYAMGMHADFTLQ